MFLILVEIIFVVLMLLIIGTQLVLPLWQGENLFPFFRSKRSQALTARKGEPRQSDNNVTAAQRNAIEQLKRHK